MMWKQWVNAVLGLLAIATPFLGMTGSMLAWTLVIAGVIVAGLSFWSLQDMTSESGESMMMHHQRPQHQ